MPIELIWSIIAILFFIGLLWILFARHNYKAMVKTIESYIEKELLLEREEAKSRDFYAKEQLFVEKQQMHSKYPEIHELVIGYKADKEETLKKLKREYYKAGFRYNLWKV